MQDYDHFNLEVGYEDGRDRVLLWLPTICKHVITDDSPLASWLKPSGIMADADATIVIVVCGASLLCSSKSCSLTPYICLLPVQALSQGCWCKHAGRPLGLFAVVQCSVESAQHPARSV